MKYTKKQKEIIQLIENGTIFDIPSFASHYGLMKQVRIDKSKLKDKFDKEVSMKNYYKPICLRTSSNSILSETEYQSKVDRDEINPESYTPIVLSIKYDAGIKLIQLRDREILIDLYEGVHIIESCSEVFEFLILWQHLKSEMLIQECSWANERDAFCLFLSPSPQQVCQSISEKNITDCIDFDTFTISDKHFIDEDYVFQIESYRRCQDFIGKRIYPSIRLSLFIKRNFETFDEISLKKSLRVAWVAIVISIIIAMVPLCKEFGQKHPYLPLINQMQSSLFAIEDYMEDISAESETAVNLDKNDSTKDEILKTLQLILNEIINLEQRLNDSTCDVP